MDRRGQRHVLLGGGGFVDMVVGICPVTAIKPGQRLSLRGTIRLAPNGVRRRTPAPARRRWFSPQAGAHAG